MSRNSDTPTTSTVKPLRPSRQELAELFLRMILPEDGDGSYFAFVPGVRGGRNLPCATVDQLVETIRRHDDAGGTVYFALAKFAEPDRRSARNAVTLKSLFIDLDVGTAKASAGDGYATIGGAMEALKRFIGAVGMPGPVVVKSGRGLHVYWPLREAIPAAEWKHYAEGLKLLCKRHGLLADPAVTADAARVLRAPFISHNRKDKDRPILVEIDPTFRHYKPSPLSAYSMLIEAAPPNTPPPSTPGRRDLNALAQVMPAPLYPKAYAEPIAEACSQIGNFRATGCSSSEPLWHAALGVLARCDDGEKLAHEWSAHDVRYDAGETRTKLNHARNATGPTSCARFRELRPEGCAACPHAGKITSPIQLGERQAEARRELEAGIAELNTRHFVITIGGSTRVGELTRDAAGHEGVLVLASERDFKLRYGDRKTAVDNGNGESQVVPLANYWLRHRDRRQYSGVDIVPNAPRDLPNDLLNLWSGWGVKPQAGDWTRMRHHIAEVLANGDLEAAIYILRWAAWVVQHPADRAEAALVFRGGKGCGKGTFLNALCKIFGSHGLHITDARHLIGNFNAHLRNGLFLFADEAFWAGDKRGESVLKGHVTEPTITIEQKGIDATSWPNRLSIAMASNADWVVPASAGERRYAVFECADTYIIGHADEVTRRAYFDALNAEISAGGLAAMLHDLLGMDLGNWHPRQIYETAALRDQKSASLGPYERWHEEMLQEGRLPGLSAMNKTRVLFVPTAALAEDAKQKIDTRARGSNDAVGRYFGKLVADGYRPGKDPEGKMRGWWFPHLKSARLSWEQKYGTWGWRHANLDEWG